MDSPPSQSTSAEASSNNEHRIHTTAIDYALNRHLDAVGFVVGVGWDCVVCRLLYASAITCGT